MKPFEEWIMSSPTAAKERSWTFWEDEGYGIEDGDHFHITCRRCGYDFQISDYITPEEFDPDVQETYYCGRSERCCP